MPRILFPPTDARPLIVGESNPYGGDPAYALVPFPDGCAGHRLCCVILRMRRSLYLRHFDRVNLCVGAWRQSDAKDKALLILQRSPDRRIILLGAKVCSAFAVPFVTGVNGRIAVLPHPSGRNRMWNDPAVAEMARAAVVQLCPELAGVIGVEDEE